MIVLTFPVDSIRSEHSSARTETETEEGKKQEYSFHWREWITARNEKFFQKLKLVSILLNEKIPSKIQNLCDFFSRKCITSSTTNMHTTCQSKLQEKNI